MDNVGFIYSRRYFRCVCCQLLVYFLLRVSKFELYGLRIGDRWLVEYAFDFALLEHDSSRLGPYRVILLLLHIFGRVEVEKPFIKGHKMHGSIRQQPIQTCLGFHDFQGFAPDAIQLEINTWELL